MPSLTLHPGNSAVRGRARALAMLVRYHLCPVRMSFLWDSVVKVGEGGDLVAVVLVSSSIRDVRTSERLRPLVRCLGVDYDARLKTYTGCVCVRGNVSIHYRSDELSVRRMVMVWRLRRDGESGCNECLGVDRYWIRIFIRPPLRDSKCRHSLLVCPSVVDQHAMGLVHR